MKRKDDEEDYDKVINTILRYPHGGLVDRLGGEELTVDELLEFRNVLYGSYGYEELKGLNITKDFIEQYLND